MRPCFYLCVLSAVLLSAACGANEATTNENAANNAANLNANQRPAPPKNPQTPFEKALFTIRVEDFEQILLFRRRDGGAFTDEDKDFLRNNSPNHPGRNVNRWVQCEDEKCFIAGTNFKFSREQLIAQQNRFDVKDLTRFDEGEQIALPEETPKTEENADKNANKK